MDGYGNVGKGSIRTLILWTLVEVSEILDRIDESAHIMIQSQPLIPISVPSPAADELCITGRDAKQ